MKKVALISSYCDSQIKLNVLKNNIKIIKSLGVDVICISPFVIDKEVIELCDYFFITKDNPVLEWPVKAMGLWKRVIYNDKELKLTAVYPDYGFAGLTQVKQLSQLSFMFDYDQFYHIIYDIIFDETVYEAFRSNYNNSVFGSKRKDVSWTVGLHLMVFDRLNLEKLVSKINLNNYLENPNSDAFIWLHHISNELGFTIHNKQIEDLIDWRTNFDYFDQSPIKETKMFIIKNTQSYDNIGLIFYEVTDNNVKILVDGVEITNSINELVIYDLGFKFLENHKVSITHNNISYNINEQIIKIKHSLVY